MSNFDFKKEYSINLNKDELSCILKFLTVNSYSRLYTEYEEFKNDVKQDEIERVGSGENQHFSDKMKILDLEDKITDAIMKNQLALGLLLEKYVDQITVQQSESKTFNLKALLMYELYITVAERVIELDSVIRKSDDVNKKNIAIINRDIFNNINKKIYNAIGLKDLSIIKIDYNNLTIEEHLELCLI